MDALQWIFVSRFQIKYYLYNEILQYILIFINSMYTNLN